MLHLCKLVLMQFLINYAKYINDGPGEKSIQDVLLDSL